MVHIFSTHICIYIYIYVCMCIYIYVCVCMCVYICTYISIILHWFCWIKSISPEKRDFCVLQTNIPLVIKHGVLKNEPSISDFSFRTSVHEGFSSQPCLNTKGYCGLLCICKNQYIPPIILIIMNTICILQTHNSNIFISFRSVKILR